MPSVAPPPTSVAAITLSVYRAPSCTKAFGVSDHNLPNLPVILGPNIIGSVKMFNMNALSRVTGAFDYVRDGGGSIQTIDGGRGYNVFNFDASRSSALYSVSETVQPSSLVFNYVIKY